MKDESKKNDKIEKPADVAPVEKPDRLDEILSRIEGLERGLFQLNEGLKVIKLNIQQITINRGVK